MTIFRKGRGLIETREASSFIVFSPCITASDLVNTCERGISNKSEYLLTGIVVFRYWVMLFLTHQNITYLLHNK